MGRKWSAQLCGCRATAAATVFVDESVGGGGGGVRAAAAAAGRCDAPASSATIAARMPRRRAPDM